MSTADGVTRVTERLTLVHRQWRDLVWIRGVGATLLGIGAPLAAWLLLDLFVNLPDVVRAVGLATVWYLGLLAFGRRLVWPLTRGVRETSVAQWLEAAEPQLQERLLTSLELDAAAPPTSRAARLMQRQVRRETAALLETLEPRDVLPHERAYRTMGLGLLSIALVLAPLAIWASGYGLGWYRLAAPFGNWGWGRDYRLTVDGGDRVIARGTDATVAVEVVPRRGGLTRPEELTLHWQAGAGAPWDARRLTWSEPDQRFVATLPRMAADTTLYVAGGAAASPRYTWQVVDPPQRQTFVAAVDPPQYTGLPSTHAEVGSQLTAAEGSRVSFTVTFDRPVARVWVDWPKPRPAAKGVGAGSGDTEVIELAVAEPSHLRGRLPSPRELTATGTLAAVAPGNFVLHWESPEGFLAADPPRRLDLDHDLPPEVRLQGPSSVTLRPDDRRQIEIVAADDFGLTVSELHVEASEADRRVIPLPRDSRAAREFAWRETLDLKDWGLAHGAALTVRARVVDNRLPHPQERWSDPQVIVLSDAALSAASKALFDQTRQAREDLAALQRELAERRTAFKELHQKLAAATVKEKDAKTAERLETLAKEQEEFLRKFDEFREALPEGGAWEPVAERSEALRHEELAAAQAQLDQAQGAEARESLEALSRSLDDLATAQKRLQELDDQIRALGNLGDELDELNQLANRSERLAEELAKAAERSEETAAEELTQGAAAGEEIANDLERLLQQRPELQQALEEFRRQEAAARGAALSELGERQAQLAEETQQAADAQRAPASALDAANSPRAADEPMGTQPSASEPNATESNTSEMSDDRMGARPSAATDPGQGAQAAPMNGEAAETSPMGAEPTGAQPSESNAAEGMREPAGSEPARNEPTGNPPPGNQAPAGEQGDHSEAGDASDSAMPTGSEPNASNQANDGQPAAAENAAENLAARQRELSQAVAEQRRQLGGPTEGNQNAPVSEPNPQAANPATSDAAQALERAQGAMQRSQAALATGDPDQAAEPAREAARELQQAATALQAAPSEGQPSSQLPRESGQALETAQRALQAGQRQLAPSTPANPTDASANPMPSTEQPSPTDTNPSADKPPSDQSEPSKNPSSKPGQPQNAPPSAAKPRQSSAVCEQCNGAAGNFRSAAEALREVAAATVGKPSQAGGRRPEAPRPSQAQAGNPGEESPPNDGPPPTAPASLEGVRVALPAGTRRNWGRLTGELETDMLDGGPVVTHPEYATQIQRYFQTIARGGAKPTAPAPAPVATPATTGTANP